MIPEESRRMMDDIVIQFGEDAATYLALRSWGWHDEAGALKAKIGEDMAKSAEKLFEDGTYGVYR